MRITPLSLQHGICAEIVVLDILPVKIHLCRVILARLGKKKSLKMKLQHTCTILPYPTNQRHRRIEGKSSTAVTAATLVLFLIPRPINEILIRISPLIKQKETVVIRWRNRNYRAFLVC
mmetsp:Transcript_5170/g.11217  ORF Transcript_5170/g.11217 Transcript_5170/m.11217 type:complete len:119 (-) Transcript_5170:1275-1631(-)